MCVIELCDEYIAHHGDLVSHLYFSSFLDICISEFQVLAMVTAPQQADKVRSGRIGTAVPAIIVFEQILAASPKGGQAGMQGKLNVLQQSELVFLAYCYLAVY